MTLKDLEPRRVWEQFDAITRVPRPSKREGRIIEYLVDFARRHAIDCERDDAGNVVMRIPASAGCEAVPVVTLQSHMDMVCEKRGDVEFDFDRDPIRTRVEDGWVRAEGTTLGADCGIGMAAALALLLDPPAEHGALEALFTVDEETGLTGAFNLGEGMIGGKYLINLDSEDEGEIFIGCAGGVDTVATLRCEREKAPAGYLYYRFDAADMLGGHSGDDIDKGRANSVKVAARFVAAAAAKCGARLARIEGGNLRNAIPRESYAVVGVAKGLETELMAMFESFADEIKAEYHMTEPRMRLTLTPVAAPDTVFAASSQQALIGALMGVACGVLAMSQTVKGLVETSTNLASVKEPQPGSVVITTSQRSSVDSAKEYAMLMVESVFRLAGAEVAHSDGYPGWAPNPDSLLLRRTTECYLRLFGSEAKVRAIHAGLECGLFLEKYPHLEMVSFGPTMRGVHSPDERLEIASVDKFWRLLREVVTAVARE